MKSSQEINQIATMIRGARLAQKMTQLQLADKCALPKYRIEKAEKDIADVPVSVLRTIIEKGLGGLFQVAFEF